MLKKKILLPCVILIIFFMLPEVSVPAKNAPYHNQKGWEHLEKGDNFRAIFSFRNALQNNASYLESIIGLAEAYHNIEAYDLAFELYSDALKIDPESGRAVTGIGLSLAEMGRYQAALAYLNRAVGLSGDDLSARYGIAYLYYLTGRKIWAVNALEEILRRDPYHYDSLLLSARVKSEENRTDEALGYINRAIETRTDYPAGYVSLGEFFITRYLKEGDRAYLSEAVEAFSNAIAVQPDSYHANRSMGYISFLGGDYKAAVEYYRKTLSDINNSSLIYSNAVSHDLAGNTGAAMEYFLSALKISPFDSVLRNRVEDFVVSGGYKIGHPARVMLHEYRFELAEDRRQKNLPDEAIMYLRRAVLLNPLHTQTRERLKEYYGTLGYYRFYLEELKELDRLYPGSGYQNRLQAAVYNRRERLYNREGYSHDTPPRDVPRVLVLNFDSGGRVPNYPDAGRVVADNFNFVLEQFGRMETFGMKTRREIADPLNGDPERIEETLEIIGENIRRGVIEPVDYVIYGTYTADGGQLGVDLMLLDLNKGYVISGIRLSESGREALSRLSLRAARRVFENIPFRGRALKIKDKGIIVNLGLFDGLGPGDRLVIEKVTGGRFDGKVGRKRIILEIKEADTLISYAEPLVEGDIEEIDASDTIYSLNKRRGIRIK